MASTAPSISAPDRAAAARSGAVFTDMLLALMAIIWAVNFSVVKFGTRLLAPLPYNAVRISLAAVVLLVVARIVAPVNPSRRDVWVLIGLGVLGNGLYQLFFILGLARTRAGTAALMLAATPALVAMLGRVLGTERIARRASGGIALQLVGVACVVFGTSAAVRGDDSIVGSALLFGAAMCWAMFAVLLKPYADRVAAIHLGAYTLVGGALMMTIVAIPGIIATDWRALSLPVWGALVYSGIGALVVANLIWYRGVRVLGPTRTSMYSNLQPLIALFVAWIMLGEVPTVWQTIGAGSIMSGLLLSRT
jgi:drug/metabolite transporter (DMT)-like permease